MSQVSDVPGAEQPEPPVDAAPTAPAVTGRRKSYGRYVLGKVAGAASSLAFVLVLGGLAFAMRRRSSAADRE